MRRVRNPGPCHGLQGGLAQPGVRPGPVDGVMGPQTSDAIRPYRRDHARRAFGPLYEGSSPASSLGAMRRYSPRK